MLSSKWNNYVTAAAAAVENRDFLNLVQNDCEMMKNIAASVLFMFCAVPRRRKKKATMHENGKN